MGHEKRTFTTLAVAYKYKAERKKKGSKAISEGVKKDGMTTACQCFANELDADGLVFGE